MAQRVKGICPISDYPALMSQGGLLQGTGRGGKN
ncbi:hypothetical protein PMI40_01639 [Herbaspirillum sp. YR522]|nr:hypothetical protein PMI40_01639 [Herbaspirillum sp. YR522]